jgi:hypothetical protein
VVVRGRSKWGRAGAIAILLCALLPFEPLAYAKSSMAPSVVQAQIMTRILPYDRAFEQKVKREVVVVLVQRADDSESASAVQQMQNALKDVGDVRGRSLRVRVLAYSSPSALAASLRGEGAHVVYIAPGLLREVPLIAQALAGSGVLSFAANEPCVPEGIVLGVEIADGKPRMSINLRQARTQKIEFPAAILKLAKVYQ